MGNLFVRQFKQWYAQSKQKGVVRDDAPPHTTPDPDLYYEFEFVIDPPAIKTATTKNTHVDAPGTERCAAERNEHDDGVQRKRGK